MSEARGTLRILGKPYCVEFVGVEAMSESTYMGEHEIRRSCIRVLAEMDPHQQRETLLHEVLHALTGNLLDEERIELLSCLLYAFARDNPRAARWIFDL